MAGKWPRALKLKTDLGRGGSDSPDEMLQSFVALYDDFSAMFDSLEDDYKTDFVARFNEISDDYDFGDALSCKDVSEIKEVIIGLPDEDK